MNKLNILNAIGELLLADTAESKRLARELVGFLRQQEACDMVATVETEVTSRQEPQYQYRYHLADIDIGKEIEVRDKEYHTWRKDILAGFICPLSDAGLQGYRFECIDYRWKQARIRVDS